MNFSLTTARTDSTLAGLPVEPPTPPAANAGTAILAQLKNRLLRETLAAAPDEPLASILRLAATEAEAQAWLTGFPLLTFPTLFEEKAEEVRMYVARQSRLRPAPSLASRD